uniref:ATP synthase F0 subunit 8 n=1 Tax=Gynaikothrips ficorum TaxID=59752 RepID=A0A7M1LC98_GYNFI|nr:ATP synthase F0 subunit 8 [Gynaikothrips ficorum]QOQ85866.1 ATP synthase F0 subunit 8 [Gynaikothrips ficorum]
MKWVLYSIMWTFTCLYTFSSWIFNLMFATNFLFKLIFFKNSFFFYFFNLYN